MRRLFVGGNWKCNGTVKFAQTFPKDVLAKMQFNAKKVDVVVAPSAVHLHVAQQSLAGTQVQLSA